MRKILTVLLAVCLCCCANMFVAFGGISSDSSFNDGAEPGIDVQVGVKAEMSVAEKNKAIQQLEKVKITLIVAEVGRTCICFLRQFLPLRQVMSYMRRSIFLPRIRIRMPRIVR